MSDHFDLYRLMRDDERFPALAYNVKPMHELAHALSAELQRTVGPVTIGSGHRLDGDVLMAMMLPLHMMLRSMTKDEAADCETAYSEVYSDD
jgi:hypothetical protein